MSCNITLREVAEFQKGFAFKSKDYTSKGVKIIKVSNLTDDSVDISQCVCVENDIADKYKDKYNLKTNDIVITTVGSWPTNPASVVGKVIRVPKYADNTLLNQNAVRLRSNSLINQNYMYYLLKDKSFKEYIIGTAQGSANQASITQEDIKNFEFILPSLEEQEKIAKILSSLDDKIELNNEMNKTLEEMAQSLFKRWFVDFEFPNENGEPYKSSGGEMVESELGMIPKGWEVNNIGNCVTFSQGIQIPVKKQTEFFKEGFKRFLRIVDYTSNDNEEPRYVEDKGDRYYCNKREVAMVRYGNSSGFICRRLEGILANNLFKINPCYPLGYNYIYYLLSMEGIQEYITSSAIGSAMPALNHSIIANIKFVVPNENTIKNFENICNQIEERICSNRENSKTISSLRDTLLPKLMSGEIRLK